jgi:hypothetical protein
MNIVQQSTSLSNRAFHPSTFGVLPAHERLSIATRALRDLAREQRKRAKHRAEVSRLLPIFPAWPVPVAVVESRSQPGRFYTCDLESSMCDCPARVYCAHLAAGETVYRQLQQDDETRAERERQNWRRLMSEYAGPVLHYDADEEGSAAA